MEEVHVCKPFTFPGSTSSFSPKPANNEVNTFPNMEDEEDDVVFAVLSIQREGILAFLARPLVDNVKGFVTNALAGRIIIVAMQMTIEYVIRLESSIYNGDENDGFGARWCCVGPFPACLLLIVFPSPKTSSSSSSSILSQSLRKEEEKRRGEERRGEER